MEEGLVHALVELGADEGEPLAQLGGGAGVRCAEAGRGAELGDVLEYGGVLRQEVAWFDLEGGHEAQGVDVSKVLAVRGAFGARVDFDVVDLATFIEPLMAALTDDAPRLGVALSPRRR